MSAPLSVFPSDRSHKWILVPGSASTRQIELCNESDAAVECHITVQEPATASAAPQILSLEKGQSSTADVNFLPSWSPLRDRRVRVIVRDAQGGMLADFSHDVIAAHSADCSISLTWSEPVIVDANLAGFKLWCKITSRGAVPGTFEINFTPHPALRFPERKLVTLAPGENSTFEVPVEWNRAVRDVEGWNHPPAVEATVPLSDGQRSAIVPWNAIEDRVAVYLTADDRKARVPQRETTAEQSYKKVLEMRALEQGVVAPVQPRTLIPSAEPAAIPARPARRMSIATLIITGMALIAVATALILFLRPWEPQPTAGPVHVPPLLLPPPTSNHSSVKSRQMAVGKATVGVPNANAVQANSSQPASAALPQNAATPGSGSATNAAAPIPNQLVKTGPAKPEQQTAAFKLGTKALPQQRSAGTARADRNAVVIALADPDVEYTSQGRAVSVRWFVQAQSHAIVEVLDNRNVTIARYSVPGTVSHAVLRLPRGYRGPVNVQVTSIGYHGERVVQSASLSPPS